MRRREIIARVGCGVVAAWLVVYALFHLAPTLPHRYLAAHWRVAWVGLDLGMAAAALGTFWLLARRSVLAGITASLLAGLILADAWFDCLTARPADLDESLLSLAAEIPAAVFFIWLAVHALAGGGSGRAGTKGGDS
jgi:hypothetical protein